MLGTMLGPLQQIDYNIVEYNIVYYSRIYHNITRYTLTIMFRRVTGAGLEPGGSLELRSRGRHKSRGCPMDR